MNFKTIIERVWCGFAVFAFGAIGPLSGTLIGRWAGWFSEPDYDLFWNGVIMSLLCGVVFAERMGAFGPHNEEAQGRAQS